MTDFTPSTILDGSFEIIELASRGAQATVFKARQIETDRLVAVKVISAESPGFADSVKRLDNEHSMLKSLAGLPAFLDAVAFNATEDHAYMAMGWIDGTVDGARFIKENSPMQMQAWLWLAKTLTMAVFECHRRGFLHRDIKPRNVLIAPPGVLKLIDFGIAHDQNFMALGESDVNLGTLPYVPPEQVARGEVGVSGEIFALGVTLYEFLTSSVPFKAETPGEIMQLKTGGRFVLPSEVSPDCPEWVDRLMVRLLDSRPENRPQGARELLSLLTVAGDATDEVVEKSLRVCKNCDEHLWRELPFCTHCGSAYRLRIESGPAAVVAHRVNDRRQLIDELQEATGRPISSASARRFKGPYPRVLVDGIDEGSATFIADALTSANAVFQPARLGRLRRLALARLSLVESVLAGVMIVVIVATVVSMPFASSIEEHGFLSVVFGRSGFLTFLCLLVIGFIVREAFAPMVSRGVFAIKRRRRGWKAVGEIRALLREIKDRGLRRRASALVRRATFLVDHVAKQKVSTANRRAMIEGLDRLTLEGLRRLLKLDQTSEAMGQVRTPGMARLRASLEKSLARAREPVVIDRLTDKLAELEKLSAVEESVTRNSTVDEAVFSGILSEINSLHVTMKVTELGRWQSELRTAAGQFASQGEDSNGEEDGRG